MESEARYGKFRDSRWNDSTTPSEMLPSAEVWDRTIYPLDGADAEETLVANAWEMDDTDACFELTALRSAVQRSPNSPLHSSDQPISARHPMSQRHLQQSDFVS